MRDAADVEIRPLATLSEFRACVELQGEIWGGDFSERVPVAILKVAPRLGGVTAGAFDERGRLVGFVFGITGIEEGRPVHWSDMLAVLPDLRDAGLGRRLKAYQRRVLLDAGVTRVYWTFDPLEAKNAWLNLGRLGAVAREYVTNMYGQTESPLHRGVGTDRFVALWLLDTERVRRRLEGREGARRPGGTEGVPEAFTVEETGGLPRPVGEPRIPLHGGESAAHFLVPVPSDLRAIQEADLELARAWREATRAVLAPALTAGWEVRELIRGDGTTARYLLERRGGPAAPEETS